MTIVIMVAINCILVDTVMCWLSCVDIVLKARWSERSSYVQIRTHNTTAEYSFHQTIRCDTKPHYNMHTTYVALAAAAVGPVWVYGIGLVYM